MSPSQSVDQSLERILMMIDISTGRMNWSKNARTHSLTQSPFGANTETIPTTPANTQAKMRNGISHIQMLVILKTKNTNESPFTIIDREYQKIYFIIEKTHKNCFFSTGSFLSIFRRILRALLKIKG